MRLGENRKLTNCWDCTKFQKINLKFGKILGMQGSKLPKISGAFTKNYHLRNVENFRNLLIENSTSNLTFPHFSLSSDISTTLNVSSENSDNLGLQTISLTTGALVMICICKIFSKFNI